MINILCYLRKPYLEVSFGLSIVCRGLPPALLDLRLPFFSPFNSPSFDLHLTGID